MAECITGAIDTSVTDAVSRFDTATSTFQALVTGAAEELETKVDGAADVETRSLLADLLDQVGGAP